MEKLTLHNGDCLEVLKTIEDNTVDSIVTDPPYGIDFMGKKWDYDVPSVEIWEQCLRVLKPGGYLLAFAGTRTQHRMAVRIEDAGFEIRDMIAWVYGSGFPKSHNISKAIDKMAGAERTVKKGIKPGHEDFANRKTKGHLLGENSNKGWTRPWMEKDNANDYHYEFEPATDDAKKWDGWGTALKPALEPITVARKPLGEKTVAENVLKYGTGAINVDESRIALNGDYKSKANGRPSQTGLSDNYNPATANQPDTVGRFPANLIHDGSEEVTDLFPESNSARVGNPNNPKRGVNHTATSYGQGDGKITHDFRDSGSAARFFYSPKTSKSDRNDGLESFKAENGEDGNPYGRWTPTKNNHPTVKPTDLMRYLVNMVTPKGGTTLDPFMGSGSTGRGAMLGDFNFIGIEIDSVYYEIAKARIEAIKNNKPADLSVFFD